ncbi:uncharacterized protein LOC121521291 isoform X2 [Cheilinus undulatus]|uniref:uncharacterized protein LOC121521291 isoform X2 n=1 Tax=Cheilinus undulatus TaxID=241271 RepID=UPI001BD442AC|nr:uncharacterized protein LOC121521291 isoform X2 [Cheilinus undulatus]
MSALLSVIRRHDEYAASVLEEAGFRSDWDLKVLTREDLRELFQEPEQLELRRKIFEIINTHKPVEELLRKVGESIPGYLRDALAGNQVLGDYLYTLKDLKVQMNKVLEFLDAHINCLEKIVNDTPQRESEKVKSDLLRDIERYDRNAARVLEKAGFRSDWKLKTLNPEDLRDLFQGSDQLQLRGKIFEIINTQPVNELLRRVEELIQGDFLRDALPDTVLTDYLLALTDQKVQMNNVQEFYDAHINFLKKMRKATPQGESEEASCATNNDQIGGHRSTVQDAPSSQGPMAASTCSAHYHSVGQKDFIELSHQDIVKDSVRYKMVVCGKTFGAHLDILEKVKEQVLLTESSDDHQITILFCVISSRVGSDVDAALTEVKDNKPIILVLMHHSREPTVTTSVRTWAHDGNDANIVLHVDVFYHETSGLVKCGQNDDAVSSIQKKLLAMYPESKPDIDTPPTKKGKKRWQVW